MAERVPEEERPCYCTATFFPCRYCFYGTATGEPETKEDEK